MHEKLRWFPWEIGVKWNLTVWDKRRRDDVEIAEEVWKMVDTGINNAFAIAWREHKVTNPTSKWRKSCFMHSHDLWRPFVLTVDWSIKTFRYFTSVLNKFQDENTFDLLMIKFNLVIWKRSQTLRMSPTSRNIISKSGDSQTQGNNK